MADPFMFEGKFQESVLPDNPLTYPTQGSAFNALAKEGPVGWISRELEQRAYDAPKGLPPMNPLESMVRTYIDPFGVNPLNPANIPTEFPIGRTLSALEANEAFAPKGETLFNEPISEGLARTIAKQNTEKKERERIIAQFQTNNGTLATFGLGILAGLTDPLNLATGLVPGIGEAAVIERLGTGLVARMAARGVSGFTGGAAATVPIEALHLAINEDPDFGMREAFIDIALGGAFGATLQGAGPLVSRLVFGRRAADAATSVHLASDAEIKTIAEEAERLRLENGKITQEEFDGLKSEIAAPMEEQQAAVRMATAQLVEGKQVDVLPLVKKTEISNAVRSVVNWARVTGEKLDDQLIREAAKVAAETGVDIDVAVAQARHMLSGPDTIGELAAREAQLHAMNVPREEFQALVERMDETAKEPTRPVTGEGSQLAADSETLAASARDEAKEPAGGTGDSVSEGPVESPREIAERELEIPEEVRGHEDVRLAVRQYMDAKDHAAALAQAADCLIGAGV